MNQMPPEIFEFITARALTIANPAYIRVDYDDIIDSFGGNLADYGISGIKKGDKITDIHSLFEGYFPFTRHEAELPFIKFNNEVTANVFIFNKSNFNWILMLDSTQSEKSLKEFYQSRNDEKLFLDKEFLFSKDDSVFDILRFLDITVLERRSQDIFQAHGKAPRWADFLEGGSKGFLNSENLIEKYPFIEVFLMTAEVFWENNNRGLLKSEIWAEEDDSGNDIYMEASAISMGFRNFLLIQRSSSSAIEKKNLIQRARELSLEHELRKKAEAALNKKNEELQELNATKDKFFSIIAHDLRNPIGAFRNITEVFSLHLNKMSPAEIQELVVMLSEQSNNLIRLLDNLLQWSRAQMGVIKFRPDLYNIAEIIGNIIELNRPHAREKEIELINNISLDRTIFCDSDIIAVVSRNLISNAIKFTAAGGRVNISSDEDEENIIFHVRDNGVGIEGKFLDKLFKIDSNTSTCGTAKEKGTGLGLILCKEFIALHGGKIWVESTPGKGSIFSFSIKKK